jgi:hypothetical protein
MQLQPKIYAHHSSGFKNGSLELGSSVTSIGLFAQDLYSLIPEAVLKPADETESLWGVDYGKLVPVLIRGMQEQQEHINLLMKIIGEMKEQIASLPRL